MRKYLILLILDQGHQGSNLALINYRFLCCAARVGYRADLNVDLCGSLCNSCGSVKVSLRFQNWVTRSIFRFRGLTWSLGRAGVRLCLFCADLKVQLCGSEICRCRRYFVHRFVRRCGSVTFVRLLFIICAAPNFVSDPDPLVLKAYTPGYVQSQIDLLKRQKKFTTKLVLEKPKLPPKKTEEDPSKGGSAQDLLKGQVDPCTTAKL